MNCCTIKKENKQIFILDVLLLITSFCVGGLMLLLLLPESLFSRHMAKKMHRVWNFFKVLWKGLTHKIMEQSFLFSPSVRCKLSGKMMRLSVPLAGALYKYFNFILLTLLILSLFGLLLEAKALGSRMHIF